VIASQMNMSTRPTVGFIGLGNMGSHMARNLLASSHPLVVYDLFPESVSALVEEGAVAALNPADLADRSEVIITMLPSTSNVQEVYKGENGVLQSLKKGTKIIDSSTIDPSVPPTLAQEAKERGAALFVDAPVSGGVPAARQGTLSFMVGGTEPEFQQVKELLQFMGKNVFHCGKVGSGQATKICNNMLLAVSMIGTSETMNLGMRLGLDPKVLANVLNVSTGRCWSSELYNPVPGVVDGVPSSNKYDGGFGTALMTKDLGLAQDASTRTFSPTPLGSTAHQIYRLLCQKGLDKKDFSVVFQFLSDANTQLK